MTAPCSLRNEKSQFHFRFHFSLHCFWLRWSSFSSEQPRKCCVSDLCWKQPWEHTSASATGERCLRSAEAFSASPPPCAFQVSGIGTGKWLGGDTEGPVDPSWTRRCPTVLSRNSSRREAEGAVGLRASVFPRQGVLGPCFLGRGRAPACPGESLVLLCLHVQLLLLRLNRLCLHP